MTENLYMDWCVKLKLRGIFAYSASSQENVCDICIACIHEGLNYSRWCIRLFTQTLASFVKYEFVDCCDFSHTLGNQDFFFSPGIKQKLGINRTLLVDATIFQGNQELSLLLAVFTQQRFCTQP